MTSPSLCLTSLKVARTAEDTSPESPRSKKAHLWLSDFRKFAEQFGDIIGWDTTNRKYILAHGMTGVDWKHYKHPLPEDVYDIYLRSWGDVDLTS